MCLCVISTTTLAEPKPESAGQQAIKKIQGMVRQLTEEKKALEAEKTALGEQIKKLQEEVKQTQPLQGELAHYKTQEESLRANNSTLEGQIKTERDKQIDLHHKLQGIVAQAKQIQNDNLLLVSAVQERERWIKDCGNKNQALIENAKSLVVKYQDKDFWDTLAENEPLTGIGKVESQNTVETYQFKLQDLKVTDFESGEKP